MIFVPRQDIAGPLGEATVQIHPVDELEKTVSADFADEGVMAAKRDTR